MNLRHELRLPLALALGLATLPACLSHTRSDPSDGGTTRTDTNVAACAAQEARGVGECAAVFGYVYMGEIGCAMVGGCGCEGADCDALYDTSEACLEAHAMCERRCGGLTPYDACLPQELCVYDDTDACGALDGPGTCTPRPVICDGVYEPVCGCDATTYPSECDAHHAGVDVAHAGACEGPAPGDFAASVTASCAPWDGAAWSFELTHTSATCGEAQEGERLHLEVWAALEAGTDPTHAYAIETGYGGEGSGFYCAGVDAPCVEVRGTVTVTTFIPSEGATLAFDVQTLDGFAIAGRVSAPLWCSTTFPGCG